MSIHAPTLHNFSALRKEISIYIGALNPFLIKSKDKIEVDTLLILFDFYLIKGLGAFIINKVRGIKMNTPLLNARLG